MALDVEALKSGLPQGIKEKARFFLWRYEERTDKEGKKSITKPPCSAVGQRIDHKNPENWSTFEGALSAYLENPGYFEGLGFSLGDGLTGVDLDDVIDEEGNIDPEAEKFVNSLPGYFEITPSKRGLHGWTFGSLPPKSERRGVNFRNNPLGCNPAYAREGKSPAVEFYDETSPKYFTITGDVWRGRSTLNTEDGTQAIAAAYWKVVEAHERIGKEKRAPQKNGKKAERDGAKAKEKPTERKTEEPLTFSFDYYNDDALLRHIAKSKEGPKFDTLFEWGPLPEHPSNSEAAAALLLMLAFWTRKDEQRMDRLFKRSTVYALGYTDKWGDPRENGTWGSEEIRKACELCKDVYDPNYRENRGFNFGYALNDSGNAQRLVDAHGEDIHFCEAWSKWLGWDGRRWETGARYQLVRYAAEVARDLKDRAEQLQHEAEALEAETAEKTEAEGGVSLLDAPDWFKEASKEIGAKQKMAKEMSIFAKKSGERTRVGGMIELAASGEGVPISHEALDRDKFLLNVGNGTLDLRTGELRPFSRGDLITRVIETEFHKEAACPTWEAFLTRIFNGSRALVDYMQKVIGYSLTGDISEQCFFILYGKGSNGKSTMLEAIRAVMGDYAKHTTPTAFVEKQYENEAGYDLAKLRGARFVTSVETKKSRVLDEAKIKAITGGDPITCRGMREDFWTYSPEFKLFLATNHLPTIKGTDHGIWRRVRCIPFNATISDSEKDNNFSAKLLNEAPGILTWAVRGCQKWRSEGLETPLEVQAATATYRKDQDILAEFLEECCMIGAENRVDKYILYAVYDSWVKRRGAKPFSFPVFIKELGDRGFKAGETTHGKDRVKFRFVGGLELTRGAAIPTGEGPGKSA